MLHSIRAYLAIVLAMAAATLTVDQARGQLFRGRRRSVTTIRSSISAARTSNIVAPPSNSADKGKYIAEQEKFLRYNPRHARAETIFKAIVQAASAPEDYERNLEYADLFDIESAQYDDQTGELILIGPRITEQNLGYMPPLLVVDDFATALRVLDAVGEDNLGVSIGTYNYGAAPGQIELDDKLNRQNVEYMPLMIANTHVGWVFFEVDRWLKNLSHGRDNETLKRLDVRIPGYRTQPERARGYFQSQSNSLTGEDASGPRPYGLNWFLPDPPQVALSGYSMRFISYNMTVQYKALSADPEVAKFSEHMNANFEAYCREFMVFQELVRLHKLVQVAKWYRACGFPDEELLDYAPLRIPTPEHTRRMSSKIGQFRTADGWVEWSLLGGIDFSPSNVYVAPPTVRSPVLQPGVPPRTMPSNVWTPTVPSRYGTYREPAPVPAFVAPVIQARPTPTTYSWTAPVGGRTLKAIAIPVTRERSENTPTGPTAVSQSVSGIRSGAYAYSRDTVAALQRAVDLHENVAAGDAFLQTMQSQSDQFPQLKLTTDNSKAQWIKIKLNGARAGMDAIRFTSPLDQPAEIYWALACDADQPRICNCILPLHCYTHDGASFGDFDLQAEGLNLPKRNQVQFRQIGGGIVLPNREYIMYFHFTENVPTELWLAVAIVPGRSANPPSSAEKIAKRLGLSLPLKHDSTGGGPKNTIPPLPPAPIARRAASLRPEPDGSPASQIRADEQFIRAHPNDPRSVDAFRRIVQLVSPPEDYEAQLNCADLADIDAVQYDDETGELTLIGPRISNQERGYMPPLLMLDDLATALKLVKSEAAIGVALKEKPSSEDTTSTDETPTRLGVEYLPTFLNETHFADVLLEADRRLKTLAIGMDAQGESISCPVAGYRSVTSRDTGRSRGAIPVMLTLTPSMPVVALSGYSMRFTDFEMKVQPCDESASAPAITAFAEHVTANFDKYAEEYSELKECVRLVKLLQVAKWYDACGFPDDAILKNYTPLQYEPLETVSVTKAATRDGKATYYGGLWLANSPFGAHDRSAPSALEAALHARPVSWPVYLSGR